MATNTKRENSKENEKKGGSGSGRTRKTRVTVAIAPTTGGNARGKGGTDWPLFSIRRLIAGRSTGNFPESSGFPSIESALRLGDHSGSSGGFCGHQPVRPSRMGKRLG
jgi:hypothetical protein